MNEEKNNIPAEEAAEEVNLSELLQLRRDKLEELRREGHDPFVLTSFDQDNHAARIVADFEQLEGKDVAIAGRIMTWRDMARPASLICRTAPAGFRYISASTMWVKRHMQPSANGMWVTLSA